MSLDSGNRVSRLREEILNGNLTRRDVLKRSLALGLSAPIIAGLLAACGGDDDDDSGTTPTEASSGEATKPPSAPGANAGATQTAEAEGGSEPTTAESTGTEAEATGTEGEATSAATEAPSEEATSEPTGETTGERGGGGKATLLYWQAPTILNSHFSQGTKDDHASRVTGEPLFDWDENTDPVLVLAEEWPSVENELLDPDGNFVIWKLRQGVKWHDGEDFTAEDVKFTWELASNEEATATTFQTYATIESIDIVDDYTVQLNFASPNPAWFDAFSGTGGIVLPKHILGDVPPAEVRDNEFNLAPTYTGPWKVTDFKAGDVVLYDIFEDYWDPGKPFFDTIEMKGGGDATSAARAVIVTGEADWAWNLQVEPQVLEQMEGSDAAGQLIAIPGTSAERIMVNFADPNTEVDGAFAEPSTEHPIWKHPEARQALNLSIQRDVISTQLYGAAGVASGDTLNVPPKFKLNWEWEYNIDKAKEQMAAINFPADFDNTNILYQTSVNSVRQKTQEIVKADLEQLGFTVELKSVDSGVFFSSAAGNPDTYPHFYADIEMYTNGPASPYPIAWATRYRSDEIASKANSWAGTNITRWNNPEFDKLHDQAQNEIDEDKQVDLWTQMMTMVYENNVEIAEVWRGGAAAVHNRIKNYPISTFSATPVAFLKEWTL